jgi:hypothetical protein
MADLEIDDSELNAKNLLRIKADLKQPVNSRAEQQRFIDAVNAEIESQGPSVTLEQRLEIHNKEQHSICTRADLAVSVIGSSIEDLTEFLRDPPRVLAIKDLLKSTEEFTDDASIEALREALVVIQDGNLSTGIDVLEDLDGAYKSLPKEHILRTSKILQATQTAVRDLATDPYDRKTARSKVNRPFMFARRKLPKIRTPAILPSESLRTGMRSKGPNQQSQNTQNVQSPDQVSDAQSLHSYIDFLLTHASPKSIVQAVQHLGNERLPAPKSNVRPEYRPQREINSDLEKKVDDLGTRVRALENQTQVKGTHEASVEDKAEVKKENGLLQTDLSHDSNKRPPPELEDNTRVKRSRA